MSVIEQVVLTPAGIERFSRGFWFLFTIYLDFSVIIYGTGVIGEILYPSIVIKYKEINTFD